MILLASGSSAGGFTLTHFEAIIGLLVGILTVLGVIATGMRWIYRQGAASSEQVTATRQNTEAIKAQTTSLDEFTKSTNGYITDHEKRITRLEAHEDTRGRQGRQP